MQQNMVTVARASLVAARAQCTAELARIDRALAALGASGDSTGLGNRQQAAPAGAKPPSLRAAILDALRISDEPLSLTALADAILATGFTSRAANFRGNVSAMLTRMLKARDVRRGAAGYTLGAPAPKAAKRRSR